MGVNIPKFAFGLCGSFLARVQLLVFQVLFNKLFWETSLKAVAKGMDVLNNSATQSTTGYRALLLCFICNR
jgi:hypothetical protein